MAVAVAPGGYSPYLRRRLVSPTPPVCLRAVRRPTWLSDTRQPPKIDNRLPADHNAPPPGDQPANQYRSQFTPSRGYVATPIFAPFFVGA